MNKEVYEQDQHSDKMDPSDLAILEEAHGSSVAWYLNSCNVVPKKTASGAFIIPTRGSFDTCLELIHNKAQLENKPELVKRTSNKTKKVSVVKLKKITPRQKSIEKWSIATNLTITFAHKPQKSYANRPQQPFSFSKLTRQRSIACFKSAELYEMMMKTYIGVEAMIDYKTCLSEICLILKEFQHRHSKFQYYTNLQTILKGKDGVMSKDVLGITLKQYQEFMYNVVAFVIPISLFGSHKNLKILRKGLKAYYLSPYKASICLKPYVYRFDISCISWLQLIKDTNTKWSIIAKITKWLFENFFVRLFRALFYELKSLYNEKRIMMSAEKWKYFQCHYLDRQLSEGRIAKVNPDDDFGMNDVKSGEMVLYPKSKGVRPIYRFCYNDYQREELGMLRTFLQQQYLQRYHFVKIEKLHSIWLTYATTNEENASRKVNLVTCDVSDAFGSIIRHKLFDIVNRMIDEIPDEIMPFQCYEIILPTSKRQNLENEYKRWFSCCPAAPILRNRSLVGTSTKAGHGIVHVKKEYIRAKLAAYIFEQTFKGQKYELRKGIVQGSQLSSILSEIYYQHMTVQHYSIFMQSGTIFRYVDDFIYITKNEDSAKRFLKAIKKKVPEYNCHFQKSKIQTNVQSQIHNKSEWVTYIGIKLNGDTMEVRSQYENTEFQYMKSMAKIRCTNSLPSFESRSMMGFLCLKLHKIILDPKINSLSGLCTTAGLAAKLLATRCVILVTKIFNDPTQYRDSIMKQIQIIVKKLAKLFRRHLTASDHAKWPTFKNRMLIAIWQSFFQVFSRNPNLRKLFGKDMKFMIRNRAIL